MTSDKIASLYDELVTKSAKESLSKLLPAAFRLSTVLNDSAFSKWARLEMNGYVNTNQAYTDDIEIPKYRAITGKHVDAYGRPFKSNKKVKKYLNKTKILEGIDTLEQLSAKSESVYIEDQHNTEVIKQHLDVEVVNLNI